MRILITKAVSTTSKLRLMQLVSPSLPVGSFAYSQGLEYAVDCGWILNEKDVGEWISGILSSSFCTTDLTLLRKLYEAWQQQELNQVIAWNDTVFACRETKEFTLQEQQTGYALKKLLEQIEPGCLPDNCSVKEWSYLALYARAAQYWQIDLEGALLGFSFAWVENQITSAIKLVPLGQVAGQRLLGGLQTTIAQAVQASFNILDDQIGVSLSGLSIASALHETQYSRLFRS